MRCSVWEQQICHEDIAPNDRGGANSVRNLGTAFPQAGTCSLHANNATAFHAACRWTAAAGSDDAERWLTMLLASLRNQGMYVPFSRNGDHAHVSFARLTETFDCATDAFLIRDTNLHAGPGFAPPRC